MARPRITPQSKSEALSYCIKTIEENLSKNPQEASKKIIAMAPYIRKKMNKIFKAELHETAGEYLNRLRLEKAKKLLAYTDLSIGDIAEEFCFKEISTFEKAFKEKYKQKPTIYRKNIKAEIKRYEKYTGDCKLEIVKPEKVMFVRDTGNYKLKNTEVAWSKLFKIAEKNNIDTNKSELFGIIHDDTFITSPGHCRYDACMTVDKSVVDGNGVITKNLPEGKCIVFRYTGPYEKLDDFYEVIFTKWYENTKYYLDERPILEKYLNSLEDAKPEELITEIYIPIR